MALWALVCLILKGRMGSEGSSNEDGLLGPEEAYYGVPGPEEPCGPWRVLYAPHVGPWPLPLPTLLFCQMRVMPNPIQIAMKGRAHHYE